MVIVDSIQELNVYVLQVPVDELQDIQYSLSLNPNFQYVSKNHVVTANAVPNDTFFGIQTHFGLIDASRLGIMKPEIRMLSLRFSIRV